MRDRSPGDIVFIVLQENEKMLFNSTESEQDRHSFRLPEKTTIKALIVHDNPLTRIGLRSALSNTPEISVIGEASNREEALSILRSNQLDIILLDPAVADRLFNNTTAEFPFNNGNEERRLTGGGNTLTSREREVLSLVVKGYTNQAIANQLIISLATAKAHVRSIFTKLAVEDRTQAAVEAMRRGLV